MIDYYTNNYTDDFGFVYSEDRKILINANPNIKDYKIIEGTEEIGEYAFQESKIEKLILPSSIKKINDAVFYKCQSLYSIILSENLKYIGDNAFRGCILLEEITLPEKVEEIYGNAFQDCSKIRKIKFPENTYIIENLFFHGCDSLEMVYLPHTISKIDNVAFQFCRNLKYVIINCKIKSIGYGAFQFCENLCCITYKDIDFENPKINDDEYQILKFFTTPLYLEEIGDSAFSGCKKLRNIIIYTSRVKLGKFVFGSDYDNYNKKIYIPYTSYNYYKEIIKEKCCTLIGYNFIKNISSEEDSTEVNSLDLLYSQKRDDGIIISLDGTRLLSVPEDCEECIIPNGIKYICDYAFFRREKLKSVKIPNSVIRIGVSAFDHCHNLQDIQLPADLKSIGNRSLACCYSLKYLTIPYNVKILPERAFYYTKNLLEIRLEGNLEKIEYRVFYGCYKMNIIIPSKNKEKYQSLFEKYDEPRIIEKLKFE